MDDDPQFNLDVVKNFIISKNFKVSNRELVAHFKPFLTHPQNREINREKFRDYVNTLSTVKQDETGEKILVLKKKYRKEAASADGASSSGEKKRDKKRDKGKSHEKETQSLRDSQSVKVAPPGEEVKPVESIASPDGSFIEDSPGGPLATSRDEPAGPSDQSRPQPTLPTSISQELAPPTGGLTEKGGMKSDVCDGAAASRPNMQSESTDHVKQNDDEVFNASATDSESKMTAKSPDEELGKPVALPTAMSVKERAKHLNKIESDSNLQNVKMRKHESVSSDSGEKKDEDSSSVSSAGYAPMDQLDRDWVITMSTADYHPMHRLLTKKPELAKRRDFITSALHWAAKHGKAEVIKMLCAVPGVNVNARSGYTPLHMAAQHGHEDIIELLVHGYNADANMRDYSGKKAKQYLRNSASSRTHQILQARRPSSVAGNGNQPFKRVGSYSAKIRKSGFFGIHGGSAMRSSWTTGSDAGSDKDRASPSPSLSPSPSPRSSPLPSPRSRRKGSKPKRPPPPARHKLRPRAPPRRRRSRLGGKCGPSPLVKASNQLLAKYPQQTDTESSKQPTSEQTTTTAVAAPGEVPPQLPPKDRLSQTLEQASAQLATYPAQLNDWHEAGDAHGKSTTTAPQNDNAAGRPGTVSLPYAGESSDFDHFGGDVQSRKSKDEPAGGSEPPVRADQALSAVERPPPTVFLPYAGESSDFESSGHTAAAPHDGLTGSQAARDEGPVMAEDARGSACEDIQQKRPDEEDGEGFSGISLIDRLLGSSSQVTPGPWEQQRDDPLTFEPRDQEEEREDHTRWERVEEPDDADEGWAEGLRFQNAFLLSAGFFERQASTGPDPEPAVDDGEIHLRRHSLRQGSADLSAIMEGFEEDEQTPTRNYPSVVYESPPGEPMVAPPRRRRSRSLEQQQLGAGPAPGLPGSPAAAASPPTPVVPPRRRKSMSGRKEARDEATSEQFSKKDHELMPPPDGLPTRKKKSRKEEEDKENVRQMLRTQSEPMNLRRAGSHPELSAEASARSHVTPAPPTSPFV